VHTHATMAAAACTSTQQTDANGHSGKDRKINRSIDTYVFTDIVTLAYAHAEAGSG